MVKRFNNIARGETQKSKSSEGTLRRNRMTGKQTSYESSLTPGTSYTQHGMWKGGKFTSWADMEDDWDVGPATVSGLPTKTKGMVDDTYQAVYDMDKNFLFRLMSIQSYSHDYAKMHKFIIRWIRDNVPSAKIMRDQTGNLYAVRGEDLSGTYPTMVAHTDTVHRVVKNQNYSVRSNDGIMYAIDPVTNARRGIGGDDKVGIFIALSMFLRFPKAKVAFFVDEEIGCHGSGDCDMTFFEDSSFVLECDRRGNDDFVDSIMSTPLLGHDFRTAMTPIIQTFGYSTTSGGMTDVWQLKSNGLGVSCANMSAGYFDPHTSRETIGLNDVQRCYDMVMTLFDELGDRQWVHEKPVYKQAPNTGTGYKQDGNGSWVPYGSIMDDDEAYGEWWDKGTQSDATKYADKGGLTARFHEHQTKLSREHEKLLVALADRYPDMMLDKDGNIIERAVNPLALAAGDQSEVNETDCPLCDQQNSLIVDQDGELWCRGCGAFIVEGDFTYIDDNETEFPAVDDMAGWVKRMTKSA